jgi:hypothetical protein
MTTRFGFRPGTALATFLVFSCLEALSPGSSFAESDVAAPGVSGAEVEAEEPKDSKNPSNKDSKEKKGGGGKSDLKFDGRVNLEVRSRAGYRGVDLPKEAVLEAETRRHSGAKAGVDIRVSEKTQGVDLREVFIDYESGDDSWKLIAGRGKKRFGLEWDYNLEDVIPLTRGIVYRKLAALGYVGRDTMIAFQAGGVGNPKNEDEIGANHHVAIHTSEQANGALLYRYMLRRSERSLLAAYTLLHVEGISGSKVPAGAQSVAYSGKWGDFRFEGQGVLGADAFATEYERLAGSGRTVFFSGAYAYLEWQPWKLRPFVTSAAVLDDLARLGQSQIELAGGARYYFARRFYLGIEGRWVRSKNGVITAYDRESLWLFALRYFF